MLVFDGDFDFFGGGEGYVGGSGYGYEGFWWKR